jgi:Tol biopolymer transport system component
MLLSIETGEKRRLTSPPARRLEVGPALSQDGDLGPALSPDGRTLAFLRASQSLVNDLYLLELSDELTARGAPRRLTFDKKWIASPVWTPDGREILFSSDRLSTGRRSLWRIEVSSSAGRPGEPQALASLGQGIWSVGISRHGRAGRPTARLAYSQEIRDVNIWRIEVPGAEGAPKTTPLVASTRSEWGPQFSPDGKRIAFWSDRSGNREIWLCDRNGSNAVQLTSFGGPDVGPVRWSPDGEHLVFLGLLEGRFEVYVINAKGGGLRRLTNDQAVNGPPSWSRDGRWIYFPAGGELWKMPANGGTAVRVTRKGGNLGLESPDGKSVYYAKFPQPLSLWKVPVDDGEETRVLESLADSSTFAVADDGIYFIPRLSPPTSLQLFSFGTGKIKQIATIEKPVSNGLSVSAGPDGRSRWILYTQVDQEGSDLMLVENFR